MVRVSQVRGSIVGLPFLCAKGVGWSLRARGPQALPAPGSHSGLIISSGRTGVGHLISGGQALSTAWASPNSDQQLSFHGDPESDRPVPNTAPFHVPPHAPASREPRTRRTPDGSPGSRQPLDGRASKAT